MNPSARVTRRKRSREGSRKGSRKDRGRRGRAVRSARQKRRILLWGHVRPGASARVVLEQSRGASGVWKKVRSAGGGGAMAARARVRARYSASPFSTSADGVFLRHAPWRRGLRYRLRHLDTSETGLPVRPLACGRKAERIARDDGEY